MPAHLTIQGIQELKIALANLPTELKGQATQIVLDTAYAAAEEVRSQYPTGPGNWKNGRWVPPGQLIKGVKVFPLEVGAFAVAAQVRSTAPHAWWNEHGSELSHERKTHKGWSRGIMFSKKGPPRPVFIPTMVRYRRAMYLKLAALIQSTGLVVKFDQVA